MTSLSEFTGLSSWKLQNIHRASGEEVYERALGLLEQIFYWDSLFARTADTLQHAEIAFDPAKYHQASSQANLSRSWINLKQQFPLLGARIEERDEKSIFFVVEADSLRQCHPEEIIFQDVASAEEATQIAKDIIVNQGLLSKDLLAKMIILRRTDINNVIHVLFHITHIITDGMSNITMMKTLLVDLARDGGSSQFNSWDLQKQLALSESTDNLYPQVKFSVAKQRWRLAVANIITARWARPVTGGHSLPRKVSQRTPYTPADSKVLSTTLPIEQSKAIISSCRKQKLTFGNVYPIIGQIATTRFLLKRYLRGEISEEEWEFRKKEPMVSAGPLSLRPFQNKAWLNAGGMNHVCLSIGFYFFSLPTMPLGTASKIKPGADLPPLDSLLSKKRFWLRSRSIKKQGDDYIRHPLFLEFGALHLLGRVEQRKSASLQWQKEKGPPAAETSERILSAKEQAASSLIFCNGGSSMGNIDALLPLEYPLGTKQTPTVFLKSNSNMLHCRPTELYLGASTSRQQLRLLVYWDNNVFDEQMIEEWLGEVRDAVDFYLGQGADIQAKL